MVESNQVEERRGRVNGIFHSTRSAEVQIVMPKGNFNVNNKVL